jgi:hypothetical protein
MEKLSFSLKPDSATMSKLHDGAQKKYMALFVLGIRPHLSSGEIGVEN